MCLAVRFFGYFRVLLGIILTNAHVFPNILPVIFPSVSVSISLKAFKAKLSSSILSGLSSFLNKWNKSFTIRSNSFWETVLSLFMSKTRNI